MKIYFNGILSFKIVSHEKLKEKYNSRYQISNGNLKFKNNFN